MLIEAYEEMLKAEALALSKKRHAWNRASSMGHCARKLGYQKLGVQGLPLTPRRMSILGDGTAYDLVLKDRIKQALGHRFIDGDQIKGQSVIIEGVEITYNFDGGVQLEDGRLAIEETKTCSNRTFEKALRGEIDIAYLAQAWVYHHGTGFPVVIFIFYRKETSHICEVIFDSAATETVITKRYGGNELEIAREDPTLVAEIRTPFDISVEQAIRETIRSVQAVSNLDDLPVGVRAIEDETVNLQGVGKAFEWAKANGQEIKDAVKSGSWFKFKTGRKIAGFPCSYCAYVNQCLGAFLEIKDKKPQWIMPSSV